MTVRMTSTALRQRDAALVWDSRMINVLGFAVQEALPVPGVPYSLSDPFVLVHEARIRGSELAGGSTRGTRTEVSTTSGTRCGARPAPDTPPVREAPWSGPA